METLVNGHQRWDPDSTEQNPWKEVSKTYLNITKFKGMDHKEEEFWSDNSGRRRRRKLVRLA